MVQISTSSGSTWATDFFLFRPLTWVADQLGPIVDHDPHLFRELMKISPVRMHVAALALAHMRGEVTPEACAFVLTTPQKQLFATLFGYRPVGLGRALGRLPGRVLPAQTYRYLVDLLGHPVIAKYLHHVASIDETTLTTLHRLPPVLRTNGIMKLLSQLDGFETLVDGLHLLATRSARSFDDIAGRISSLDQPDQIAGAIKALAEGLPLPDTLPPQIIGPFRRLDSSGEIRSLAEAWQNCLADCVCGVNDGTYAVYVSDPDQAVSLVCRYGRLGWFLAQTKGPANADLNQDRLRQVHATFREAGIPIGSNSSAVRSILLRRNWPPREVDPLWLE